MLQALGSQTSFPTNPATVFRSPVPQGLALIQDALVRSEVDAATPPKKWTVLVYAAADNNLYPNELDNLKDIETVGSTSEVNVVAQFDGGHDNGGARRMLMQKVDAAPGELGSKVVKKLGQVDMADPKVLADFIEWGTKKYPAEHTMVIINDHGGGWRGCVRDESGQGWMKLPDLKQGLQMAQDATGKKLDVLGFDACLMGMEEVAHEVKDNASFVVASQETEGVAGWPYSGILNSRLLGHMDKALVARLPLEPVDVAKACVTNAGQHQADLATMSAYDISKESAVKDAMATLASAIKATPLTNDQLQGVLGTTQVFYYGYRDLYNFCENLQTAGKDDATLVAAAKGCQDAIKQMVVAEEHGPRYPGAHGVSFEATVSDEGYEDLDFAKDVPGWADAQKRLANQS